MKAVPRKKVNLPVFLKLVKLVLVFSLLVVVPILLIRTLFMDEKEYASSYNIEGTIYMERNGERIALDEVDISFLEKGKEIKTSTNANGEFNVEVPFVAQPKKQSKEFRLSFNDYEPIFMKVKVDTETGKINDGSPLIIDKSQIKLDPKSKVSSELSRVLKHFDNQLDSLNRKLQRLNSTPNSEIEAIKLETNIKLHSLNTQWLLDDSLYHVENKLSSEDFSRSIQKTLIVQDSLFYVSLGIW